MRIRELERAQQDGTPVALVDYGFGQKVVVVDVNATRQVPTAGVNFYRTHSARGIRVRHETGKEEVVHQGKLFGPWNEWVAANQDRRSREASAQQHRDDREAVAKATAERVKEWAAASGIELQYNDVEIVGIGGSMQPGHYRSPYDYAVRVRPELLSRLLGE